MKFLERDVNFLQKIPKNISKGLDIKFNQSLESNSIKEYFRKLSLVSEMLMRDPGTFEMLEIVYTKKEVKKVIDEYLLNSLSAQALRNRLKAVIFYLNNQMKRMATSVDYEDIKIINLGSGSGRDTIEALAGNSQHLDAISIDCVDTDVKALIIGEQVAKQKKVDRNFRFIQESLSKLSCNKEYDIGLLIGILCGLEHRTCVMILKRIKRYFKKGGILIASNVLDTMSKQDPFLVYLLTEIIGWKLVFKTPGELQEIFEEAGYKWKGIFYDEPTKFHGMGIGMI